MFDLTPLAVPSSMATLTPLLPPPPARILEVGCGRGALAAELGRRGYDVTGLEPGPEAFLAASARGVRVLNVPLADYDEDGFDVVLFTRSLHHVPDLDGALDRAVGRLAPGGAIVLEEFARERIDAAGAAFLYDTLDLLRAAGIAETPDENGHAGHSGQHAGHARSAGDDPMARWEQDIGDRCDEPLHTGAAILDALARRAPLGPLVETEALWRLVAYRLTGPDRATATAVADLVHRTERRRIAEGTLPAIGFVTSTR